MECKAHKLWVQTTHLQLTNWSFGIRATIWQMATSTQRTKCKCVIVPTILVVKKMPPLIQSTLILGRAWSTTDHVPKWICLACWRLTFYIAWEVVTYSTKYCIQCHLLFAVTQCYDYFIVHLIYLPIRIKLVVWTFTIR